MTSKVLMSIRRILTNVQNRRTDRNKLRKTPKNYGDIDQHAEFIMKFLNTKGKIHPTFESEFKHTKDHHETIWPKTYEGIKGMTVTQKTSNRKISYYGDASNDKWKINCKFVFNVLRSFMPSFLLRTLIKWGLMSWIGPPVDPVIYAISLKEFFHLLESFNTSDACTKIDMDLRERILRHFSDITEKYNLANADERAALMLLIVEYFGEGTKKTLENNDEINPTLRNLVQKLKNDLDEFKSKYDIPEESQREQ